MKQGNFLPLDDLSQYDYEEEATAPWWASVLFFVALGLLIWSGQ